MGAFLLRISRRLWTTLRAHPLDVLGVLLAIVYALPTTLYVFGSDQAIHWYLGLGLLHGKLPYVHGISGKPPGIFIVHALAILLFGNTSSAIRLLEIAALPLCGLFIVRAVRARGELARDGELGAATLFVSVVDYSFQDYWNTGHPEFWMGVCLLGALELALHDVSPRRRALGAGALTGFVFVLKYTGVAVALPIAIVIGLRAYRDFDADAPLASRVPRRLFALVRAALWFLLGFALVLGVCILPYLLTGTFQQMREVCWDMTVKYGRGARSHETWASGLWKPHGNAPLTIVAGAAWALGMLVVARRRAARQLWFGALLAVLVVAALLSVSVQGRYFGYHYIVLYPFCALAFFWGARQLLSLAFALPPSAAASSARWRGPALLGLVVMLSIGTYLYAPTFVTKWPHSYPEYVDKALDYVRGKITRKQLDGSFYRVFRTEYRDMMTVSQAVRRRAHKGDTLCMKEFASPIFYMTGLECTTRHTIGYFVGWGPKSWKREYIDDLRNKPATFFVVYMNKGEILRWQRRHYEIVMRAGNLVLLQREQPDQPKT